LRSSNKLPGFDLKMITSYWLRPVCRVGLYLLFAHTLTAQELHGWRLEKNKNGIQVYSQQLPNARLKDIKVVCQLTGTLSSLVAVLSDVDHNAEWVYSSQNPRLIRRVSEQVIEFYTSIVVPWPLSDRDLALRQTLSLDPATGTLHVRADSEPALVPPVPGKVRIPFSLALWTVKSLPDQQLAVEYTFSADPGGHVPAWLVNLTVTTGPYQSFLKLRQRLTLAHYQHQQFNFLRE
jgi:hypothetical protein